MDLLNGRRQFANMNRDRLLKFTRHLVVVIDRKLRVVRRYDPLIIPIRTAVIDIVDTFRRTGIILFASGPPVLRVPVAVQSVVIAI